jgi:hypothetical protein
MNHNYYYTLLGRRAGGPGSASTSDCSDSLQFRYMQPQQVGGLTGATGDTLADWEGLVFGNIVEVWPDQPQLGVGTRLYLDAGLTQEISLVDGNWYRVEELIFTYQTGGGIAAITQINQPTDNQIRLSGPSPTSCQLGGPYTQPVWVSRDQWQQVDRIWLDQALSQPFVGGNNWYSIDDSVIPSGGTTLQVNNCGWVEGFFAC